MTHIKRFLLALALPLFLASYSNAQVSTTGNLIQDNAWTGCWTPTADGFWGGTSGGPCPGISNNGYADSNQIIFSYQQQTISQTTALANALPNSGTGLQVNGYNWHWHVKNSNINDGQPGSYDTTAYITVDLLNASGSILESDKYDYGYRISDWINPSGSRTYTNPYSLASADSIRLSITGKDDGFWAGYWGPEFMHVTLNVNYSVDPCYDNPFYSPTCPGFAEALAKLTPDTLTEDTTEAPEVTQYGNDNTSSVPTEETTIATTPSVDVGGAEISATGEIIVSDGIPATAKESVKESIAKEEQQVKESAEASVEKKPGPKINPLDVARQAVAAAESTALSVVADSTTQSLSVEANPIDDAGGSDVGTGIRLPGLPFGQIAIASDSYITQSTNTRRVNLPTTTFASQEAEQEKTSFSLSESESKNAVAAVDMIQIDSLTVQQQEQKQEVNNSSVRNGGNVEGMEGGVDVATFTRPPADFNQYLQSQLADASFYTPKEIYKGQVNVDNRRAMRGLGSDRLHQEMVRQQYQ